MTVPPDVYAPLPRVDLQTNAHTPRHGIARLVAVPVVAACSPTFDRAPAVRMS